MSLTSHVEAHSSPVYTFIQENLPQLADRNNALRVEYRQTIPDEEVVMLDPDYARFASLAGGAIERRLTWSFNKDLGKGPHHGGVEVVARMQRWLNRSEDLAAELAARGIGEAAIAFATSMTETHNTDNRSYDLLQKYQDERLLIRAALGIATLDAAMHSGGLSLTEQSFFGQPIKDPSGATTVGEGLVQFLSDFPEAVVEDIYDQVYVADMALTALRSTSTPDTVHSTPNFEGSPSVGGGDADLIANGLLLDIKSTHKVRHLPTSELRQLIGYALLDSSDVYGIESLGLYRSRNGHVFSVEVPDFLRMAGCNETLPVLREKFAEQVLAPLDVQRQMALKQLERDREHMRSRK